MIIQHFLFEENNSALILSSPLSADLNLKLTVSDMCFALVTNMDEGKIAVTLLDLQEDKKGSNTGVLLKTGKFGIYINRSGVDRTFFEMPSKR